MVICGEKEFKCEIIFQLLAGKALNDTRFREFYCQRKQGILPAHFLQLKETQACTYILHIIHAKMVSQRIHSHKNKHKYVLLFHVLWPYKDRYLEYKL